MSAAPRVLVIGPRGGLLRALNATGLAYVVWSDRPRTLRRAEYVHVAPIAVDRDTAEAEAKSLDRYGPFTHIIAGTESAVVPASIARRTLGARKSAHSVVIRCHDKLWMKRHLAKRDIPMTRFLGGKDDRSVANVVRTLGLPVVSKPRRLSGGRGVEVIHDESELVGVSHHGRILERYVDAPEVSVESFVSNRKLLFESTTEYYRKGHVNVIPAGLDGGIRNAVLDLNRRVVRAMNISWGMTHAEMYLTDDGPILGEIALRPPGGYIMELLRLAYGFDAWSAFLAVELEREFEFPEAPRSLAAVVVLYPGEGRVRSVSGFEELSAHPTVARARLRVAPGDRIAERTGVGVDVGYVLLAADTREEIISAIDNVDRTLRIEIE